MAQCIGLVSGEFVLGWPVDLPDKNAFCLARRKITDEC